jgi:CSLREA domain-containing protein
MPAPRSRREDRIAARRVRLTLLLAVALAAALLPGRAAAATFAPTTTADGNNGACTPALCTLRDAIIAANAGPGNDVSVPAGHYTLSLGQLLIEQSMTVAGAGARTTTVDAQGTSRVFSLDPVITVTIRDLTITGGAAGLVPPFSGEGGGILADGSLHLLRSAVVGNRATFTGGGVSAPFKGTSPMTTITDSLIANNRVTGGAGAGSGGGLNLFGDAMIANSTVTGNSIDNAGDNQGGGVTSARQFMSTSVGRLTLLNTTIAGNSISGAAAASFGAGLSGDNFIGPPFAPPTFTELISQNTIIANNTVGNATRDCGLVTANSSIFNLSSDATCGFTDTSSKQNTNPQLLPLADNGGPTNTLAIADASPAKNAGTNSGCPGADQRGVSRPQQVICDIGAYERKAADLTVELRASRTRVKGGGKKTAVAAKRRKAKKLAFIATVSNRGEQAAPGTRLSLKLPAKAKKLRLTGPCEGGQKTKKKKKKKGKRRGRKVLVCVLGNVGPGESKQVQVSLRATKRKGRLKAAATISNTADPTTATAQAFVRIKKKKRRR